MKIGICTWSFTNCHAEAGQPLDPFVPADLARMAADRSLASIECAPGPILAKTPAELDDFKQLLADHQLDIFIDTGGSNYAEDTTPLRTALDATAQVGARVMRTTISNMLEGDRTRFGFDGWKAHLQSLVDPFKSIMPLAEKYGIPIGLENHQDASSWELIQLIEQVGSPLLGVTMDVANALAVGETPEAFARRVMPHLKHVHFKDYTIHPTPSGYRFKRCAVGDGVVDWPAMVALFEAGAPGVQGCIELGASQARHVRILERDYWSTYPARPLSETIDAIRTLHRASRPPQEDWRTPHERDESVQARVAYEMEQLERSVAYIGKNL